jgi:predicted peroxiredoxin
MFRYLLIEAGSSCEWIGVCSLIDVASQLIQDGRHVDLFLIQNGVLMARDRLSSQLAEIVQRQGITVWVDDWSLKARSLTPADLVSGVRVAGVKELIELLTRPCCKSVWH